MRKLPEDPMGRDIQNNTWHYEMPDGRRVYFDRDAVRKYGAYALAKSCGLNPFDGDEEMRMVPVYQRGEKVGVVPATFDPDCARSSTFLCDFRPGDFVRDGDRWIACNSLGPGDLDALTVFRRTK